MTKKDFYKEIRRGFEAIHPQLAELNKKSEDLQAKLKDRQYSEDVKEDFREEQRKINHAIKELRADLRETISKKAAETISDIESTMVLNGSDLTADVKLFNTGVPLSKDDVLSIMKRNADNLTVLKIAQNYMDMNNMMDYQTRTQIEADFPVLTNYQNDVDAVTRADLTCKMILSAYPDVKYSTTEFEKKVVEANNEWGWTVVEEPVVEEPQIYRDHISAGSEMYNELYGKNSEEGSEEE